VRCEVRMASEMSTSGDECVRGCEVDVERWGMDLNATEVTGRSQARVRIPAAETGTIEPQQDVM
jgi:hypothetical protein